MPERPAPTISTSTWSGASRDPLLVAICKQPINTVSRVVNLLSGILDAVYRGSLHAHSPTHFARRPARGRRTPRASGDERERAILATAERLLEERPLGEISVEDLASGAGISRPTFYFYFPSKDAVLLTLVDRMVEEAAASREEALAKLAEDPRAGLAPGRCRPPSRPSARGAR